MFLYNEISRIWLQAKVLKHLDLADYVLLKIENGDPADAMPGCPGLLIHHKYAGLMITQTHEQSPAIHYLCALFNDYDQCK